MFLCNYCLTLVYDMDKFFGEIPRLHVFPEVIHRIIIVDLPIVDDGQVVA